MVIDSLVIVGAIIYTHFHDHYIAVIGFVLLVVWGRKLVVWLENHHD